MKALVFALALASSLSAQALTLHTCALEMQRKGVAGVAGHTSKTVYLANARGNRVFATEMTSLMFSLPMVGVNADVLVNGQWQFIFKGTVANGYIESAYDAGSIKCDAGREVAAYYQSNDVTMPAQAGYMLGSCYVGDSRQVAKDLVRVEGFAPNAVSTTSEGTVVASRNETQCLVGHGTNPDDYVCEKRGVVNAKYKIENCDKDSDPR